MKLSNCIFRSYGRIKPSPNPEKHLFLRKFNVESESYAWFGRVFEIKKTPKREPSLELVNEVAKKTFTFFHSKYPDDFKIEQNGFEKVRLNSWGVYDVNFSEFSEELVAYLNENVINNNTRLRVNIEKEFRSLVKHNELLKLENEPIESFVFKYANHIETDYLNIYGGKSNTINRIQIESVRELLGLTEEQPSKLNLEKKDQSVVNRFFDWIHS